jgi:hypothetical protein
VTGAGDREFADLGVARHPCRAPRTAGPRPTRRRASFDGFMRDIAVPIGRTL